MTTSQNADPTSGATFDGRSIEALREKYAFERDRRIRPDGLGQYRLATGEFSYYAKDPYTPWVDREPLTDTVDVLIVGGGFGGLLTAAKLRESGVESIRVVDEAGDFGGTWYWNRFPGVHCDIESYVYMPLLDELGYIPSSRYAPGEEIRQHALAIADRYDLRRDAAFHTKVTDLAWDDTANHWVVSTDRGDRMVATFVITSSGTMATAKLPGIDGLDTFRGHTFHSSRWDYGYTGGDPTGSLTGLADKRVAVVGTGATGVQVIPAVAADAGHLFVVQRTPATVDVRDQRPTDPAWAESLKPGWQRERMDNFLSVLAGEEVDTDLVGDAWTTTAQLQRKVVSGAVDESLTADERERRDELVDAEKMTELRARVDAIVDDPATAELLKPWYRFMCKRPTFSDLYLQAFNQPNVTLVDTADHGGITRITENSIVVGDAEYEVDCIVFATGFNVGMSGILSGEMTLSGRGGKTLWEEWGTGMRTLHGIMINGFPNFFVMWPLHNANSVNFTHILAEQAGHIAAIVTAARERVAVAEPSSDAVTRWTDTIESAFRHNSDFLTDCTPGYYNSEGTPIPVATSYSPGPISFHQLLARWREHNMDDVLGGAR